MHSHTLTFIKTILREAVLFVADQFTAEEGRDEYLQMAKDFRMPFWGESPGSNSLITRTLTHLSNIDWARPDLPVFPVEANGKMVQVIMPEKMKQNYPDLREVDGSVEIPNPLFAYKFPDAVDSRFQVSEQTSQASYVASQMDHLLTQTARFMVYQPRLAITHKVPHRIHHQRRKRRT